VTAPTSCPVTAGIRQAIGKQAGDTVTACLLERLGGPARAAAETA
jgi:hypothetical protein